MADDRLGSVARRLAATERVLVVEDEHDIADFLFAYFRAAGYDLVHIDPDTALEVLDALDEHAPDCVLLDLNLRGFSGVDAYRLLRTDDRYALLPVIVVSARPDARQLLEGVGGVDAFVTKPFNVNTLADLVADRIAHASQIREEAADPVTGLLGHEYVEARLLDELTVAAPDRPASFALVQVRSLAEVIGAVGQHGADYAVQEVIKRIRSRLPDDVAVGLTRTSELALLVPHLEATQAAVLLRAALEGSGSVTLPGGADVRVRFAAGLASYPEHASDADGLYMAADAALADACEADQLLALAI